MNLFDKILLGIIYPEKTIRKLAEELPNLFFNIKKNTMVLKDLLIFMVCIEPQLKLKDWGSKKYLL
jgi:hypothetical protein